MAGRTGFLKKVSHFGDRSIDKLGHHSVCRNTIAPNFRLADTSIDDGWSIIYDQIIGVESIYGIGLGIFPPSIKASIYRLYYGSSIVSGQKIHVDFDYGKALAINRCGRLYFA